METLLDEIKVITIPPDSMPDPLELHPVRLPTSANENFGLYSSYFSDNFQASGQYL
jgi:hypothetical protein